MLIHNKDDIEFVTEFPCFLGHPVGEEKGGGTWQQALHDQNSELKDYLKYLSLWDSLHCVSPGWVSDRAPGIQGYTV